MIQRIQIENFRGIAKGDIGDFTPLTVLVGPNGSGKSSVLEAAYLANNGYGAAWNASLGRLSKRRGFVDQLNRWLLRQPANGASNGFLVRTIQLDGSKSSVAADIRPNSDEMNVTLWTDQATAESVSLVESVEEGQDRALSDVFTDATTRGAAPEAKAILRRLLPDVTDIQILTQHGRPMLFAIFGRGAIPVSLSGEGARLLLRRALELAAVPGGTVLLEEAESHLHPAALRMLSRAVWVAIDRQIQVILTTHSLDLIDALLSEAPDDATLEQLSLFRLRLDAGQLQYTRVTGPRAAFSRNEIQDDLR